MQREAPTEATVGASVPSRLPEPRGSEGSGEGECTVLVLADGERVDPAALANAVVPAVDGGGDPVGEGALGGAAGAVEGDGFVAWGREAGKVHHPGPEHGVVVPGV